MSKAILVFEMPHSCVDCPCRCFFTNVCNLKHKDCKYNAKRPKWCPLREVPEKKLFEDDWSGGYNKCIDEILGGTEG